MESQKYYNEIVSEFQQKLNRELRAEEKRFLQWMSEQANLELSSPKPLAGV